MVNSKIRRNNSSNRTRKSKIKPATKSKEDSKPIYKNYFSMIKSIADQIISKIISYKNSLLKIFLNFINLIKNFLLSSILVPAIAGGALAGLIITLFMNSHTKPIVDIEQLENRFNNIEIKQEELNKFNKSIEGINNKISQINEELIDLKREYKNIDIVPNTSQIEKNFGRLSNLEKKLEQVINNTQKTRNIIISANQTDAAAKYGLATLLISRLESGVPYSGILEGLELEDIDPALIRFANAGAPTIADLAARLSGRAGEVRDANRTANESGWKEKIADELGDVISVRRSNPSQVTGAKGALLRAEDSLRNGKLNDAISQIESIDPQYHGPLAAWLIEATARQQADRAADKLLKNAAAKLKSVR